MFECFIINQIFLPLYIYYPLKSKHLDLVLNLYFMSRRWWMYSSYALNILWALRFLLDDHLLISMPPIVLLIPKEFPETFKFINKGPIIHQNSKSLFTYNQRSWNWLRALTKARARRKDLDPSMLTLLMSPKPWSSFHYHYLFFFHFTFLPLYYSFLAWWFHSYLFMKKHFFSLSS